jgi:hypothetical protein
MFLSVGKYVSQTLLENLAILVDLGLKEQSAVM